MLLVEHHELYLNVFLRCPLIRTSEAHHQGMSLMYHETKCRIKFQNVISHDFISICGVKKIDVLSPTLFNLYINNLVNKGNNKITVLRTILQRESQNS